MQSREPFAQVHRREQVDLHLSQRLGFVEITARVRLKQRGVVHDAAQVSPGDALRLIESHTAMRL